MLRHVWQVMEMSDKVWCAAREQGLDSGEMDKQKWERWVVSVKFSSTSGSENRPNDATFRGLSREAMNPDFLEH